MEKIKRCGVKDCDKTFYAKGWCQMHYRRWWLHGSPDISFRKHINHGLSHTKEYLIWNAMRNRCQNPKTKSYAYYGARGIKVCTRWQDFENFYKDMGERPSSQHSLDRRDNNKDYMLENCRWATKRQQSINQRKKKNNTSNYRGVAFHKLSGKWQAHVTVDYKQLYLGLYITPEEAAYVRDQVAIQLYGDDAILNVIMS